MPHSMDGMSAVGYVNTGVGNPHTGDVSAKRHNVYVFEGDANVVAVYSPTR